MARTRTINGHEYEVSDAHPIAELLPWMGDEQLLELAADIGGNRQLVPIDRLRSLGCIIDGRNRELACKIAGVEPVYRDVDMSDAEIAAYVRSINVPRRHLTQSQKAMFAADLATLGHGGDRKSADQAALMPLDPVSQKQAAETIGVSERMVRHAKSVKENAPELAQPVRDGKIDVQTADKVAKLPKEERKKVAKAADPKKKAREVLAKEAVAQAHEEQTGEKEEDAGAAFVAAVESLCRDMDQIAARVKALKDAPFAYTMHLDSAASQVQAARQTLWQGRPAFSCPYCKGEGCDVCKRTGRVKKATFESGTKAMEGQA